MESQSSSMMTAPGLPSQCGTAFSNGAFAPTRLPEPITRGTCDRAVSVHGVFTQYPYGRPAISMDVRTRLKTRATQDLRGCPRPWHHLHTVGVAGSSPAAPTNPKFVTPLEP